jgi:hypothetical protein
MSDPRRTGPNQANLKPRVKIVNGKAYWTARGYVPVRQADGSVKSVRIEPGISASIRTEAGRQAFCEKLNREYEERAQEPYAISFASAYLKYMRRKQAKPAPYYSVPILEFFGEMACKDITDDLMDELVDEIFPDGAAPATINRHIYTPVIAILHMALRERRRN